MFHEIPCCFRQTNRHSESDQAQPDVVCILQPFNPDSGLGKWPNCLTRLKSMMPSRYAGRTTGREPHWQKGTPLLELKRNT